jgi:hypothetical protein
MQIKRMQRLMSRSVTSCAFLLMAALPCLAGAPADRPPPGFHDVTIGSGDHKSVVRVQDSTGPHFHGGSSPDSGPNAAYDPEAMNFGKSSSMADKSFSTSFASLSKNDNVAQGLGSQQFATHSFTTTDYRQSGSKYQTAAYKESSRSSDEFSKTYALPASTGAGADANRTFAVQASEFQGKTAQEASVPGKTDPFATPSSLSEKTFFDPELKHVRRDHYAPNLDVERLADLPNRPLTIDEVRNLINHEQIPNLNAKPDESSKALNAPDWSPEPTPAPARADNLPVAPPAEMEKDGDLPSPGEMAQPPENSQPLPK